MPTEEETFKKLQQCTLREMAETITEYCKTHKIIQVPELELESLLRQQGWTKVQYLNEITRLEIKLGII